MKKISRRNTVLINRSFQYKIIAKFLILNVIVMALFGFLIFLFLNSEIESNLHSAHVSYSNLRDMLMPIVITLSIINVAVSSIIIFVFVLFSSHKIAGPMYRFNAALEEMTKGNFTAPTSIRDDDQLVECSVTLGKVTEMIISDLKVIKEKVEALKSQGGGPIVQELDEIIGRYNING